MFKFYIKKPEQHAAYEIQIGDVHYYNAEREFGIINHPDKEKEKLAFKSLVPPRIGDFIVYQGNHNVYLVQREKFKEEYLDVKPVQVEEDEEFDCY